MKKALQKVEEERLLRIVAKGREEYRRGKRRKIGSLAELIEKPKNRKTGPLR